MTHTTRVLLLASAMTLGLGACSSRVQVTHRSPPAPTPAPTPAEPAPPVVANVPVEVRIASVTLANDCPPVAAPAAARAMPSPPADVAVADAPLPGSPMPPAQGDSLRNGRLAAGFCQRTAVQLSIHAPAHYPGGTLEVLAVRLFDSAGAQVGTLEVRGQSFFGPGAYVEWDGTIQAGEQNVSLHTSAPNWVAMGEQRGYGQSFRIEVDVRTGGETRTLEMAPVNREPMIVT